MLAIGVTAETPLMADANFLSDKTGTKMSELIKAIFAYEKVIGKKELSEVDRLNEDALDLVEELITLVIMD